MFRDSAENYYKARLRVGLEFASMGPGTAHAFVTQSRSEDENNFGFPLKLRLVGDRSSDQLLFAQTDYSSRPMRSAGISNAAIISATQTIIVATTIMNVLFELPNMLALLRQSIVDVVTNSIC